MDVYGGGWGLGLVTVQTIGQDFFSYTWGQGWVFSGTPLLAVNRADIRLREWIAPAIWQAIYPGVPQPPKTPIPTGVVVAPTAPVVPLQTHVYNWRYAR